MADRYDAIIIGAGIIGVCIGLELSRRGWRTLNIDRLPTAGYGSTSSSSAIVRTFYSTETGTALAWEGLHAWKAWRDHVGAGDDRDLAQYISTGCLVLKTGPDATLDRACEASDRLGIPWEAWAPGRIGERFPGFDLRGFAPVRRPDDPEFGEPGGGGITGAVFFPEGGYVNDPQLAAHNARLAAGTAGAAFLFNARVAEIRHKAGRVEGVALATGETLDSPVVINAGGPHSSAINRLAGVDGDMRIRTRPMRREVAHVPAPDGMDAGGDGCVIADPDVGCYSRPEIGNHLLIGTPEPECDPPDWADPDDFDRNLTDQWRAQVWRAAQRMPGLPIPHRMQGVVDLYDVSDDWIPVYDRAALGGWYMAIGTSGNQFKNAPVVGALMAELIERCEAGHDHDRDPVRFALPRTGGTIDLGFFSRLRGANEDSSFSVLA